jgi:Crp-like helix-turn-helix protein
MCANVFRCSLSGVCVKLEFTPEEIAQMIGTSRNVTGLFGDLKKRQIVQSRGSTPLIRNKAALKAMVINQ